MSERSDRLDQFAIAALPTILEGKAQIPGLKVPTPAPIAPADAAKHAYIIAQAMEAERQKHQPKGQV